jgi:hypothetical protein
MPELLDFNEPDFGVVHKVARGVYTLPTRFSFMGAHPINNRSIIVHLPGPGRGALAIINPAELVPEAEQSLRKLQDELEAPIRYLISPGDWHYLFIGHYIRAFPEARAYVAPGRVPSKAPDYDFTLLAIEDDNPLPELAPALVVHSVKGLADFTDPSGKLPRHELAFWIPAIEAVTSGDVFYFNKTGSLLDASRAIGQVEGRVDFHSFKDRMIKDPRALARSLDTILGWDFDRYLSIHGPLGNMRLSGARDDIRAVREWVGTKAAQDIEPGT